MEVKNFDLDQYLQNDLECDELDKDDKLESSKLESEIDHFRNMMTMYGLPKIGNILPGLTLEDTRATLKSIKGVCARRKEDIEFKTNIRKTINDFDTKNHLQHEENAKLQNKINQLTNKNKQLTNQLKQTSDALKEDTKTLTSELEDLKKCNLRLSHQVTQQKHEFKKLEQQNTKLKDKITKKIFDKDMNIKNTIDMTKPIYMNGPMVYVNKSGENEFTYFVTKANQEVHNTLRTENEDLRDCIKMLQDELLDIVKVKIDNYKKRYNTEFRQNLDQEFARHDINPINKDLIQMPYEEAGKTIVLQFQENIRNLRDFLNKVDQDMAATFTRDADAEGEEYDPNGEFANVRSVSHLKHLLKNYKEITEAQEEVIKGDLVLKSKQPFPDEIITPNSRFRIISDREIDQMRERLEKQKILLEKEQTEIDVKKSIIEQKSTIY